MAENLSYANTNSLWGSFLVECLARLGVRRAVVSPGSRSAPLAYALAMHPGIRATPVLDERSAGFFALGIAKRVRQPVVLVCSSGTAAANFFPAVIEAREARVPLLVLTADRPPEMRDCASGQTIDQVKLFGHYPRWQGELALPEASERMLVYLRQTVRHACERAVWPVPGPVHLNVPFRDPLAPVMDGSLVGFDRELGAGLLDGVVPVMAAEMRLAAEEVRRVVDLVAGAKRVVIVAGPASPADREGYCEAVWKLATVGGMPVLADVLSPVRQLAFARAGMIGNYDFLLERGEVPEEEPDLVLRLGALPTSKRLRRWLGELDCLQLVVEESDRNVDPLHGRAIHLRSGVEAWVEDILPWIPEKAVSLAWLRSWMEPSRKLRAELEAELSECEELFEGKIPWVLAKHAPAGAVVFISNSTPIRDAESFWQPGEASVELCFNRGANGIDGIVSTAMGVASEEKQTFLVTGDLAFLHDQNGLLNARAVSGGLTILLINNNGGGIFRGLPVAEFDPPFEEFFVTAQNVDFATVCAAHGILCEKISKWAELVAVIEEPWLEGVRVVEIPTDSVADLVRRRKLVEGGR